MCNLVNVFNMIFLLTVWNHSSILDKFTFKLTEKSKRICQIFYVLRLAVMANQMEGMERKKIFWVQVKTSRSQKTDRS